MMVDEHGFGVNHEYNYVLKSTTLHDQKPTLAKSAHVVIFQNSLTTL